MAGVAVICCHCGESFDERTLKGAWLDRRCPRCGKRVSERDYDAKAQEVISKHRPQLGKRGRKSLDELAMARYYTSEWFRLACAGQGSTPPGKGLFGLKPGYRQRDGAFDLVPADDDRSPEGGWGISAEYFVFDALREEIENDESPLHGAFLLPHLKFPWLPGQKPKQWGAKQRAEMDCVLLCRSCAIVVEVKRRSHHVRASADFMHVRERTDEGSFRSASEPIEQVERCVDSLEERQDLYPRDRILTLIVYVEPPSFTCKGKAFRDNAFISYLDEDRNAHFLPALREQIAQLEPLANQRAVEKVAAHLLEEFGNTSERRKGCIICGQGPDFGRNQRRTAHMLDALGKRVLDSNSPLHGAQLLTNLTCEVQTDKRNKTAKMKRVTIPALLLTRSFALVIDTKRWPVHVNTHAPFATVYTGDPKEGAKLVQDSIRHDWDLDEICYKNRSGSLTLLTYLTKSLTELDGYRERNRVYTLNVFIDPTTFYSDGEEFRQKTYIGFWKGRQENVFAAVEHLFEQGQPIMSQKQLDELASTIGSIGN